MALGGTTSASFKQAAERIRQAAKVLDRQGGHGALLIADEILLDVKASRPGAGVPFKHGTLSRSGIATPIGTHAALISFGSAAAWYALKQHETLAFRHRLGEARYLVRGIERWKPDGSAAMLALSAQMQAALNTLAGLP